MSKAFTKESEDDEVVVVPPPLDLPPGVPNYLTPMGIEVLRRELERLTGLPPATGASARLAAEGRLAALRERLGRAEVVDPARQGLDRARFGTVVVIDRGSGVERVALVGIDEAEPARGRLSWRSPLGRVLLGAAAGDVVNLQTPRGEVEVEVLAIERLDPER